MKTRRSRDGLRGLHQQTGRKSRMTFPAVSDIDDVLSSIDQNWPDTRPRSERKGLGTLADEFHASSFNTKLDGRPLSDACRSALRNYRALLRRAEKWTLDDDAVRTICHLSHEIERLEPWSFLARLPFDVMWIEFDLHTKLFELQAMGKLAQPFEPDKVAPRSGFLLFRDDEESSSPKWIAVEIRDGISTLPPLPTLISYVFDPEGGAHAPCRGSRRLHMPSLNYDERFDGRLFSGYKPEQYVCGILTKSDHVPLPDWVEYKSAVVADQFWTAYAPRGDIETARIMILETRECAGVLRWIVTLLAAINAVPKQIKPLESRKGVRHVGMNVLPYFQHRSVSLTIPRDDRVVYARTKMDHAAAPYRNQTKPWHRVRGHWRLAEYNKLPTTSCLHEPAATDESGLGICSKCGELIRWRKQHHRGDPAVGIVEHTYQVRSRKDKKRST